MKHDHRMIAIAAGVFLLGLLALPSESAAEPPTAKELMEARVAAEKTLAEQCQAREEQAYHDRNPYELSLEPGTYYVFAHTNADFLQRVILSFEAPRNGQLTHPAVTFHGQGEHKEMHTTTGESFACLKVTASTSLWLHFRYSSDGGSSYGNSNTVCYGRHPENPAEAINHHVLESEDWEDSDDNDSWITLHHQAAWCAGETVITTPAKTG